MVARRTQLSQSNLAIRHMEKSYLQNRHKNQDTQESRGVEVEDREIGSLRVP